MNPNTETRYYEISSKVSLHDNMLCGQGGVFHRLDKLEEIQAEQQSAYWKGIGIISGVSATSAFIGALVKTLF